MAGLIGSSNSPISGVGILAVVSSALVYMSVTAATPAQAHALTAFTLFATAIVFSAATIANGNLAGFENRATGRRHAMAPADSARAGRVSRAR